MTENEALEMIKSMTIHPNCEMLKAFEFQSIVIKALEDLEQYRAIGTVKGYERAIESSIENYNLYREYKAKVQDFEAIGTIEEFKALKEKNVAKKIDIWANGEEHCPFCDKNLTTFYGFANCFSCGQKIDWQ